MGGCGVGQCGGYRGEEVEGLDSACVDTGDGESSMKFFPLFFYVYCEADKIIERYWLTLRKGKEHFGRASFSCLLTEG